MCWGRNKVCNPEPTLQSFPKELARSSFQRSLVLITALLFPPHFNLNPSDRSGTPLRSCLGNLEIAAVNMDQNSQDLPGWTALPRPLLGTASSSPGSAGPHLHVRHGELGAEAGDAADGIARLLVLWEAVPPIHGGVS